jgi:hypothetical protein
LKKKLPLIILGLGVLLMLAAGLLAWYTGARQGPAAVAGKDIPATLAKLPLGETRTGVAALDGIQQLHSTQIPLVSGVIADYGSKSATLWIAETASDAEALKLVESMDAAIAGGGSPFTPKGVFQFRNRDIYMLETATTSEFFMQSGKKVLWVSISPDQAEQAMKEMLDFYP